MEFDGQDLENQEVSMAVEPSEDEKMDVEQKTDAEQKAETAQKTDIKQEVDIDQKADVEQKADAEQKTDTEQKVDINQEAGSEDKMDDEQMEDADEVKAPKKPKKIGPEPVEPGVVYAHTQNVVVSASIHRPLPLVRLAAQLEGAEYNPEQFPGLILKITEPKASALLFSSGKVICTGTKSIAEAKRAIDAIIVKVEALGLKVTGKPNVEVTNIVASGSVGGRLNLNSIIFTFENTEYEPEQFPGLVYKMPDTHVTFLLFGTGRVVITGAKSQKEIITTIHRLRDQLVEAGELEADPVKNPPKK